MILMIDNYDSFTYNIVQYLGELGAEVATLRNDEITLDDINKMAPKKIILSPGPCTPNEAGICLDVVKTFADQLPIFGVCLGHQSIAQAFGGRIVHAKEIMHGKISHVHHGNQGVFKDLPNPMQATRYHSLVAEIESLPDCFDVTAWTNLPNGEIEEIMGIRHKTLPIEGVQFHPESIMTPMGHQLLQNFLDQ